MRAHRGRRPARPSDVSGTWSARGCALAAKHFDAGCYGTGGVIDGTCAPCPTTQLVLHGQLILAGEPAASPMEPDSTAGPRAERPQCHRSGQSQTRPPGLTNGGLGALVEATVLKLWGGRSPPGPSMAGRVPPPAGPERHRPRHHLEAVDPQACLDDVSLCVVVLTRDFSTGFEQYSVMSCWQRGSEGLIWRSRCHPWPPGTSRPSAARRGEPRSGKHCRAALHPAGRRSATLNGDCCGRYDRSGLFLGPRRRPGRPSGSAGRAGSTAG